MRAKTYYAQRPKEAELMRTGNDAIIYFRENIAEAFAESDDGDGSWYEADEYCMTVPYTDTLAERLEQSRENWLAWCKRLDRENAEAAVRAERDKLLRETDANMALDRLGLDVPTGTTFSAWLSFLSKLGEVLVGDMAKYRQALRDVPQQEGFPYNVVWPEAAISSSAGL